MKGEISAYVYWGEDGERISNHKKKIYLNSFANLSYDSNNGRISDGRSVELRNGKWFLSNGYFVGDVE